MRTEATNQIGRLAALPSSAVADAIGRSGALGPGLRRFAGIGPFAGRVRTIDCRGVSPRSVRPGVEACERGDVLVVDARDAATVSAQVGELVAAELTRRGVVAVVVHGYVRDVDVLRRGHLHVYALGVTPIALLADHAGEVDVPLEFNGVGVAPGDVIVGDDDGLVRVSAALLESAADIGEAIVERERAIAEQISAGESLFEVRRDETS